MPAENRSHDGSEEPLTHLLPCIISLASSMASDESTMRRDSYCALQVICKDDCLSLAIANLLRRTSIDFVAADVELSMVDTSATQQRESLMSILQLCLLIVYELAMAETSSSQKDSKRIPFSSKLAHVELQQSLNLWKNNLADADQPDELNQVLQCISVLESQCNI